jgi:hypothetical protein
VRQPATRGKHITFPCAKPGFNARICSENSRVLKPGGRFAVSHVVTRGAIADEIRQKVLLWVGCIAGALDEAEYQSKLKQQASSGIRSLFNARKGRPLGTLIVRRTAAPCGWFEDFVTARPEFR